MSNPMLRNFGSEGAGASRGTGRVQQAPTAEQMQGWYDAPAASSAQTGRMTFNDVLSKTGLTLGTVIVLAIVGWMMPGLALIGAIGGLVLGLVNSFKREPSPALILAYAACEGVFLGGISRIFQESSYQGIVVQAVLATLGVFIGLLVLYRAGILRTSPVITKVFAVAAIGYLFFALANLGTSLFAGFNMRSDITVFGLPLGVIIGVVAVLMASYSLVMDFENIEHGIGRLPAKFAWSAAFGLTVSLVWLYVEILRILYLLANSRD